MILFLLLLFFENSHSSSISIREFCKIIDCDDTTSVCGIRQEGEGFRLKLFTTECQLLEHGCLAGESEAYGIIKISYCEISFKTNLTEESSNESSGEGCADAECPPDNDIQVCASTTDHDGFRLRTFDSKCQLWKYNCENNTNFIETDSNMCNGMHNTPVNDTQAENIDTEKFDKESQILKSKTIVIVDNMINVDNNINKSVDDFFEAINTFGLPVEDVTEDYLGQNSSGRRMRIRYAGPVKVFHPRVVKPKNVSTDIWHQPTLKTCYHKCPTKCPDTYAPVCAVPGNNAREPTLIFKNHCWMDAAQCKMKYESKSPTAAASGYEELSFLMCFGDEMYPAYRFYPVLRSLQHMGRLKKKGRFRYRLNNMKFFNNYLSVANPRIMG